MLYGWLPSATASSTPVAVTVCGELKFALVNVTDAGDTVPSVALVLDRLIVTFAVGCELRTIVNVAECCALVGSSVVTSPLVGVTVIPGESLSVFVTATSAGFLLL